MQITPAAKKARNSQLEEYNFNFFKFEKKSKIEQYLQWDEYPPVSCLLIKK